MSVAQLYWHLAPKHEVGVITKSLVRLLRSHRYTPNPLFTFVVSFLSPSLCVCLYCEDKKKKVLHNVSPLSLPVREVQYIVLQNIATMSIQRKVSSSLQCLLRDR